MRRKSVVKPVNGHYYSDSVRATEEYGRNLAKELKSGSVIAFFGGMGMGKTAFVRGLSAGMKLKGEVCSPTFSLVNEYRSDATTLYHFDMYRITSMDDLYSTGFFDYLDTDAVLAVEWSENITYALPENTIFIMIKRVDDNTREIEITGDERFENTCG